MINATKLYNEKDHKCIGNFFRSLYFLRKLHEICEALTQKGISINNYKKLKTSDWQRMYPECIQVSTCETNRERGTKVCQEILNLIYMHLDSKSHDEINKFHAEQLKCIRNGIEIIDTQKEKSDVNKSQDQNTSKLTNEKCHYAIKVDGKTTTTIANQLGTTEKILKEKLILAHIIEDVNGIYILNEDFSDKNYIIYLPVKIKLKNGTEDIRWHYHWLPEGEELITKLFSNND